MKRPAFQFYPADYRKDMALHSCSVAARGLWMDMLCIAHECEPYGHLAVNGRPMTVAQIGRHAGLVERECAKLIGELEDAGVFGRTSDGVIYSRRMVRDEDVRNRRADGGKAGAGHGSKGAEYGSKGGRPRIGRGVLKPPLEAGAEPALEPPPSSSSSASADVSDEANASSSSAAPTRRATIPCPYAEIVGLYHEALCPPLPRVRLMTASRETAMRKRWAWVLASSTPEGRRRAQTADEAVEWFRRYFDLARANDFLMGRVPRSAGHENWTPDLDFLLTDRGLRQVVERTEVAA